MKQLLLHHCCAPCSPVVIASFITRFAVSSFWFNPNIQPSEEYASRYTSLKAFVHARGLSLAEGPACTQDQWMEGARAAADRCAFCYRFRLTEAARAAHQRGISCFSTTLLVSPYQKHELIKAIGEETGKKFNVDFIYEDFRKDFYKGKDIARKQGSYIQKYCGCLFSKAEREHARTLKAHAQSKKLSSPSAPVGDP